MSMGIKIIGLALIVISFAYLLKNPSQSMMEGLMKQRRAMSEKEKAKQNELAEPVDNQSDNSDIR